MEDGHDERGRAPALRSQGDRSYSHSLVLRLTQPLPRAGFPAVEPGHVEQQAQLAVLPDEPLELGHKALVIRWCQLPAVFFIELNGHFGLLFAFRPGSTSNFESPACLRRACRCTACARSACPAS